MVVYIGLKRSTLLILHTKVCEIRTFFGMRVLVHDLSSSFMEKIIMLRNFENIKNQA